MKNRIISVFLSLVLMMALMPTTIYADDVVKPMESNAVQKMVEVPTESPPIVKIGTTSPDWTDVSGYNASSSLVSVQTKGDYPWQTYLGASTLVSTNVGISSSVSILRVRVIGSGALMYKYRVYSGTDKLADSLLVSVGSEITAETSYSTFDGERYFGDTDWQDEVIAISAGNDVLTDIYFAYRKDGSGNVGNDCALLKDIHFSSERAMVTAVSSNLTYGTVAGSGEYFAGEDVTLTATPVSGGKFFGWQENGLLIQNATEPTYTFLAGDDRTITAVFGDETTTVAQNHTTGSIYTDIASALSAANANDTVVVVNDTTLSSNATVQTNTKLYIPYSSEFDSDGNEDGDSTNGSSPTMATEAKTYRRLTIESGKTLTVNGELLIGGIIGYKSTSYQGHTSSYHGRITNNGTISVNSGVINCYGFIDGTGTVEALSGDVYEPFVVYDFAGGNNTEQLYNKGQNPFIQYTMQNISCTLVIHSDAKLGAYCNLYAGSQYNKTLAVLMAGKSAIANGVIRMENGATITRTVDKTKSIPGGTGEGTYGGDIYRTNHVVSGGAELGNMQMLIYGFDVSIGRMPVSYAYSYELTNGHYEMSKEWCILPGGELRIDSGADLTVNATLYALNGLINSGMSGRYYPNSAILAQYGFATNGVLMVDGTLTFADDATFGGIVQTNGSTGQVITETNTVLKSPSIQIGALGYYDDNTCVMELNGQVFNGDKLVELKKSRNYYASSGTAWTLDGYTVTEYASESTTTSQPTSGKYTQRKNADGQVIGYTIYAGPETVTTNQPMKGVFTSAAADNGVEYVYKTYYDEDDNTRTVVSDYALNDGDATFRVNRTNDGSAYNFIVQYSMGTDDPIVIEPDSNGIYTILNIAGTVTITVTSIKKGDVNKDSYVDSSDSLKVLNFATSRENFDDLQKSAADVNNDGYCDSSDSLQILYFATGRITEF